MRPGIPSRSEPSDRARRIPLLGPRARAGVAIHVASDAFGVNVSDMNPELDVRQFETRYRELLKGLEAKDSSEKCVQCVGCAGCMGCTFCRDSQRLVRCHYCISCQACSDCSHCRDSRQLISCQHCIQCESSSSSSYLVRSVSLTGCTYCFGCVGLSGKDFHILNQPYERREYFETVRKLSQALRLG